MLFLSNNKNFTVRLGNDENVTFVAGQYITEDEKIIELLKNTPAFKNNKITGFDANKDLEKNVTEGFGQLKFDIELSKEEVEEEKVVEVKKPTKSKSKKK